MNSSSSLHIAFGLSGNKHVGMVDAIQMLVNTYATLPGPSLATFAGGGQLVQQGRSEGIDPIAETIKSRNP